VTQRPLRARLRRLRFALFGTAAMLVILAGVVAGIVQLAMPWLERHPEKVQAWLSERIGRPVRIARVDGEWIGGGPVLALQDVAVGAAPGAPGTFFIPRAELALDAKALFRRDRSAIEFRISGLQLTLQRTEGSWKVDDFPLVTQGGPVSLGALGAIEIRDLDLRVRDDARGIDLPLDVPIVRLIEHDGGLRVLARARMARPEGLPLLDVVVDWNAGSGAGLVYAGARSIDLAPYGEQPWPLGVRPIAGRGTLQAWARVRDGRIDDVRARIEVDGAVFASAAPVAPGDGIEVDPRVAFERFAFVARWMRSAGGWTLDVADFVAGDADEEPTGRVRIEHDGAADPAHWRVQSGAMPLRPLGDLAMLATTTPAGLRDWLYGARPRGILARASLDWRGADAWELDAAGRDGGFAATGTLPGVASIDADLRGDAAALLIAIPQQALAIEYPHVFRWPFAFSALGGDIVAWRTGDGVRLGTGRVGFEGEGFGGEIRGSVDVAAGRRPRLDLYGVATHGDVTAAKRFWPVNVMPASAVGWLDRALVGGSVHGRIVVRGDLADWPFRDRSGIFLAQAEVEDAVLDYHEDWPRAEGIDATARFLGTGPEVEARAVRTMKVEVRQARASIPELGRPLLALDARAGSNGLDLLAFLRATPIGKRHAQALADLSLRGRAIATLSMELPVKQPDALRLDGSVDLDGATIALPRYDVAFSDARGRVRFDARDVRVDALRARFRERDASLDVRIGSDAATRGHAVEAVLRGTWPVASVFDDAPVLAPAFVHLPGESVWQARIDVPVAEAAGAPTHLTLSSDLRGTAIRLPAPLDKPADAAWPVEMAFDLPYAGRPFAVKLADVLAVDGVLPAPGRAFAARLAFGDAGGGSAIPASGVSIEGRVRALDVGGWLDFVPTGAGSASLFDGLDLRVGDLRISNRHFPEQRLEIRSGSAGTEVRVDGSALAGSVYVPPADPPGGAILAEFARVHWPATPTDGADAAAFTTVAPASLPPLRIAVDDFRLGSASFGSATFESRPQANGMRIDRLATQSPNISMQANGEWTGGAGVGTSRLEIELGAQNLGHMMDALGFPGLIDGGTTRARIEGRFPGPPSAFALANLEGSLEIEVGEGRILDVEPGAGRLFGLFSLTEIPRRLSLDFSDFFRSGLSFNSIGGRFRLTGGDAWTDDLVIKSPAADVRIEGRTGLRARDYDQRMHVVPHAGAALPVVGAIAAGPVGAAAGLVMQGILSKPIGKAVERDYRVTGPWEKPVIEAIGRGANASRPASAAEASPPDPAAGIPPPTPSTAPWDFSLDPRGGLR